MTHKPIHTYGKRALRNRKPTSNTAAGPRRDSTDDASSTEPESEARCDDAVPSVTVQECTGLPSPAAASTSTHARPASFVVPEVVIYPDKHKKHSLKLSSPQHTRNTSSVKSRDRSNISPSFAKADASHLCQVETDLKGKGRMRETLGSGNESSDDLRMISSSTEEESDCVYVATWSQHPLYLKRTVETDESEDDLPNSEALATPRRTTKRGRFQPCGTADLEVRDARKAPRESPRTRRKNLPLDKHTSSLPDNVPPLRKHDSIDSLFDGLLEDDQPASRNPSHRPSTLSEQSRISFHSQMIGRPENREVPTSFLCEYCFEILMTVDLT